MIQRAVHIVISVHVRLAHACAWKMDCFITHAIVHAQTDSQPADLLPALPMLHCRMLTWAARTRKSRPPHVRVERIPRNPNTHPENKPPTSVVTRDDLAEEGGAEQAHGGRQRWPAPPLLACRGRVSRGLAVSRTTLWMGPLLGAL